jgi:hypothetical protein
MLSLGKKSSESVDFGPKGRFSMQTNWVIHRDIRDEIVRAFDLLGADSNLLTTLNSWGDSIDDAEVLRLLRVWNLEETQRLAG